MQFEPPQCKSIAARHPGAQPSIRGGNSDALPFQQLAVGEQKTAAGVVVENKRRRAFQAQSTLGCRGKRTFRCNN